MLIFAHPNLIIYESQNSQTLKRMIPRYHMRLYDLVQDLTNPSRTIKKYSFPKVMTSLPKVLPMNTTLILCVQARESKSTAEAVL